MERKATIASAVGLHARPASIFSKAAEEQPLSVTISKPGGDPVDASSVLMLMTLGAEHGDEVVLEADGDDADRVLGELADILETDLDAE